MAMKIKATAFSFPVRVDFSLHRSLLQQRLWEYNIVTRGRLSQDINSSFEWREEKKYFLKISNMLRTWVGKH